MLWKDVFLCLCLQNALHRHILCSHAPSPRLGPCNLQITAMQIASLKRLSKGTTLYIMDRNGSMAKAGESAVVSSRLC